MITRRIFAHYMGVLSDMHRYPVSQPTLDEYFAICALWLDEPQFVDAVRRLAASAAPYWPKPGQILEAAGVTPVDGPTALARIRGAVQQLGADAFERERVPALPPILRHALKQAGGVAAVAGADTPAAATALAAAFGGAFGRAERWRALSADEAHAALPGAALRLPAVTPTPD